MGIAKTQPKIAVFCHMFYPDLFEYVKSHLERIPLPCDLYLSTNTPEKEMELSRLFRRWDGSVTIRVTPNRGRDIAPKLIGFADCHAGYDYVLHLHTKKGWEGWREFSFKRLLGSPELIESIFRSFNAHPFIGMIAPEHYPPIRGAAHWGPNRHLAEPLAKRMGVDLDVIDPLKFPSGSMFWARPQALQPLLNIGLAYDEFPEEGGEVDGTIAHAIERLFYFSCLKAGYEWRECVNPEPFAKLIATVRSIA